MDKKVLEGLIEEGLTQREIGERLCRSQTTVRYWLKKHNLKTKHGPCPRKNRGSREKRWSREKLLEAVKSSTTIADTLRKLGLSPRGANYKTFKAYIEEYQIDTSHFLGQAHGTTGFRKKPDSEVFKANSSYSSTGLYKRLVDKGWIEKCTDCGIGPAWNDKPLRLHVDHINGDHRDHRLGNLRFLCPNCHSQTKTFGGKNHAPVAQR